MTRASQLAGIYVITDAALCARAGLETSVRNALLGGARLVQYRDKSNDADRRLQEGKLLAALCEQHDALLIINDDIDLARECGAHGIHLGRDDPDTCAARRVLGDSAVIGVSCYNDLALAEQAATDGADYLAFGSVFSSAVKPGAVRASLQLFSKARRYGLPLCAIGGINTHNIGRVARAGADLAAVISAVFASPDICAATRKLHDSFCESRHRPIDELR